jgi:hypothetical protein
VALVVTVVPKPGAPGLSSVDPVVRDQNPQAPVQLLTAPALVDMAPAPAPIHEAPDPNLPEPLHEDPFLAKRELPQAPALWKDTPVGHHGRFPPALT